MLCVCLSSVVLFPLSFLPSPPPIPSSPHDSLHPLSSPLLSSPLPHPSSPPDLSPSRSSALSSTSSLHPAIPLLLLSHHLFPLPPLPVSPHVSLHLPSSPPLLSSLS